MKYLLTVLTSVLALSLPLNLWKMLYPITDLALIPLILVSLPLIYTTFSVSRSAYLAKISSVVLETSPLSQWLTGKIYSTTFSLTLVIFSITVIAWQTLTASIIEITSFILLCIFASSISLFLEIKFKHHLKSPFAKSKAIFAGGAISALLFIPVLAYINWRFVQYPVTFQDASLREIVVLKINELPDRRGIIAEVLSWLYAVDASKIWLVLQIGGSRWATFLYSIDAALVSFAIAQSSAIMTIFIHKIMDVKKPG